MLKYLYYDFFFKLFYYHYFLVFIIIRSISSSSSKTHPGVYIDKHNMWAPLDSIDVT